ncbi:MAG TPA: acyclic terpene utilization AtuA family protein, partial [Acidimicrobiales bacterium]|nr:acyclic terpene utilization AtuA family protein [Acidimicrobiales bacterium]
MTDRRDTIRIANCGGFWGDDPTAARRQVNGGPVDYLVMDYLAEVTMAILQKQKAKDPATGYARDFLVQLRDVLVPATERGIKIITNAGGVNPAACGQAVERLAAELGVGDSVRVAVIDGDDLFPDLESLLATGEELTHMETGRPLSDRIADVSSANVYVGAAPIVAALEMGANVIVAGRVTDTGVTLAPMIHEFGWAADDWDRLAAGIVAGHIIECGTQCTGGNFTDWQTVPDFADIGYPIVEASADGTFAVTKHAGTGGLVNVHTVTEQLLYEMGAPAYLAPDCIAHFDTIRLAQEGPDRVRVSGIKGDPPPERLKVAVSYGDGWRSVGRILVGGPDALTKAEKAGDIFWKSAGGADLYEDSLTQFVGWDASHPPLSSDPPNEILLQVSVRDHDRAKIEKNFAPMVVGRLLGSVPAFTIPADQGRPRSSEVVGHWPALISRDRVVCRVAVGGEIRQVANTATAY